MKTRLQKLVTSVTMLLMAILFFADDGFSQTSIFANPITGTNITASPYTSGQSVDANVSSTGIARGGGLSSSSSSNRYNASGWTTSNSLNTSDYFSFPITPDAGYHVKFSSFVYTGQRSGSGPTNFAFRHTGDGFSGNIGSPTSTGTTISLTAAAYQNITAATEFRLYGYNADQNNGSFSVDDFTFSGSTLGTTVTSLTGFSACLNTAGTAQSFTVNGSGLSPANATITVAPTTNYEVSITSATTGFLGAGSATFTASSGSVSRQVWVRLKANATAGNYNSELINVSGGGFTVANDIEVSCSGSVSGNSTLTFTSAPGTDNQTRCISTSITNITYLVGGSGTGANVSGLPAGVTGSYNGGTKVFTISGSPTASGTFGYSVTTTGPCSNTTLTGTITVTANSTLTLTSGAGSNNQTRCINNAISDITYNVGGTGTGAGVTGLPAGVTGDFDAGVFTISGTPTVSGTFNFTVTTTGPCSNPSLTGTLTINANSTLAFTSAPGTDVQTKCISTAITNITYQVGGGGTGASVTGLPTGVTGSYNGGSKIYTISGTPSVSGTFNYTVTTAGPCINPSLSGSITVTANSTLTLTSGAGSNLQTICQNNSINDITYSTGGTATGAGVTGLPAGVTGSFDADVFTISGTPTASGTFNFSVTPTGPCANPTLTGTITVNAVPVTTGAIICQGGTGTISSSSSCPEGSAQTAGPTFTASGASTGTGISWSNPGRVNANDNSVTVATGFGTAFSQALHATNLGFNLPSDAIVKGIQVTIGRSRSGGFAGEIQDNALHLLKGGSVTGNNLGATSTNWPTSEAAANYGANNNLWGASWTASDINSSSFGVSLVVDNTNTQSFLGTRNANVDYVQVTVTYAVPGSIEWFTASSGGTSFGSGSPFNPAGVLNSGLPDTNTPGTTIFYAECSTIEGCRTATTFTINPVPVVSITGASTICIGGGTTLSPTTGGNWTSNSAAATVSNSGVVTSVTPGTATFTFTESVNGCSSTTAVVTINDHSTLTLSSAPGTDAQTVCINNAITNITYAIGGGGTGASITAGNLPAGVTGSYNAGVFTISGTPTETGSFSYLVTTEGPCNNESLSGTLLVNADGTLSLTSAEATSAQVVCINNAITDISYTVGGASNSASITAGALPTGVTGSFNAGVFTISGTPTEAGVFNFTVTASGSSCINPSLSGSITVNDNSVITLSSANDTDAQTLCINNAISNITYAITGGGTGATITAGVLPNGVTGSFNAGVFTISGTPTESGNFSYTVTTTGPCINNSLSGTITVNADGTLTLNSAPGTDVQTVCINTSATDISYIIGGTATSASLTAGSLPNGVTGSFNAGVFTISGTPTESGTFNYTITTSGSGCVNPSLSGTLTVSPLPTVGNISGPTGACVYTGVNGLAAVYTVSTTDPSSSFVWTVPAGAIGLTGQGTNTISFRYPDGFSTGTVDVTVTGTCGSPEFRSLGITSTPPVTPAAIIGEKNVCAYVGTSTQITYSIAPVADAITYRWTLPGSVNLVSASPDSTSITVTFGAIFSGSPNKQIRVRAISGCANSSERIIYLVAQYAGTPQPITGPTDVCGYLGNAVEATYVIPKVPAASSYIWTTQAGTTNIIHPNGLGENDTIVKVTFEPGFSTSLISVRATNDCGTSSARSLNIVRNNPPTPGLISGPTDACGFMEPGGAEATYTIRKMTNALSYQWSTPGNWHVDHPNPAGPNDTTIKVRFPSDFTTGSVSVSVTTGCGSSTTPRTLAIGKLNPGTPGVIDVIQTASCPNRQFTYTIASMPLNATSVQWTVPTASGAVLVNGQGTTSITVSYPGTAVAGVVTAQAVNNCGSSVTRFSNVKLPACPPEFTGRNSQPSGNVKNDQPVSEDLGLVVYPNPTNTDFNVKVVSAGKVPVQVRILDLSGRTIRNISIRPYTTTRIGSELKAGTYILEVIQGKSRTTQKLMKF